MGVRKFFIIPKPSEVEEIVQVVPEVQPEPIIAESSAPQIQPVRPEQPVYRLRLKKR